MQLPRLVTFIAFLLVGLSLGLDRASGQEESHPAHLVISKVTVSPNKKKFKINVTGKIEHLPKGAKVEFRLTLRSQTVESYKYTVEGGTLRAEFDTGVIPVTPDKFTFITVVDLEEQPSKVKSAIKKNPKAFPPAMDPWTEYHPDQTFLVGDMKLVEAENEYIRTFFTSRISALSSIRKEVIDKAKAVEAGEEFVKDGVFEPKLWRKWFDVQAVAKIRVIQGEVEDAWKAKRFQPFKRACFSMRELTACIAVTALDESKKLYKSAELEYDEKDTDADEHKLLTETRTRMPTAIRELKRLGKAVRGALPAEAEKPAGDGKKKNGKSSS